MVSGMPAFRKADSEGDCRASLSRTRGGAAYESYGSLADKLVLLLDRAHYVRYDFSTATKLLEVSRELKRRYGTLTNLLAQAKTAPELSGKLQNFKHIGPVTARIFLREVRPIWYRRAALNKHT